MNQQTHVVLLLEDGTQSLVESLLVQPAHCEAFLRLEWLAQYVKVLFDVCGCEQLWNLRVAFFISRDHKSLAESQLGLCVFTFPNFRRPLLQARVL